MKNIVKLFLLILIPLLGVLLLSYPGVWKFRVENILNRKILKDSGWHLTIGDLSGHLLKEIQSKDIYFTHENGTQIFVPELETQFNILQSLFGKIYLKELGIHDFSIDQKMVDKKPGNLLVLPDLEYDKFPFEVDKLKIDGIIKIALKDTVHQIDINLLSAIHTNNFGLNIDLSDLYLKHYSFDHFFRLNTTKITINNRSLVLYPFNGALSEMLFDGRINFMQDEVQKLNGTINVNNIVIPEKLFEQIPIDINFSKINSNIRFDTDFKNYSGFVTIMNNLGLNMTGDFNVSKFEDRWLAQQIVLKSDKAKLIVHGYFINNEEINANFNLEDLDLSKWLVKQPKTNISGQAQLSSEIIDGYLNYLKMDLKTEETELFESDTINVDGSFVYENNNLNISEPLLATIGSSSFITEGSVDFENEIFDLNLKLSNADVFIINNFWNDSLESGLLAGNVNVYGEFDKFDINGSLIGQNIKYKDFYLSDVELSGQREHAEDFLGSATINANEGYWRNIEFETAELLFDLYNDETHFKNINIKNNSDYLTGSGTFNNKNAFLINDIKTLYSDHYFVNTTPISIKFENEKLDIDYFSGHLDDGTIESDITYSDKLNGYLKFSNITADLIHPIIKNPKYKFKGLMFGEIGLNDINENQNVDIDISVKNGGFTKKPFEHMKAVMTYENQLLEIEELTIREMENAYVKIQGKIPYSDKKLKEKIHLEFDIKDTDYKTIAQFLPDWYEISGIVTGSININGFGTNMLTELNGTVQNGKFDRIDIGNAAFRGTYDGRKLIFNSFSSDIDNDHFTGYGYLPVDLNIHSDDFGHFRGNDSLYIFVEGKTSNLDFITNYFDEVDTAPGDYTLALELSGIWDRIVRNGRITANKSSIFIPYLDDPIEELNGYVHIDNNKLTIDKISGKMFKKNKRRSSTNENILLSGELDLTSFFDPYIKINAKGKNAFFRSLIYEMEGITDFNINITGRDTILISGEVAPVDFEIFQPLTSSDLGILPSDEGSTIMHYKVDFPIKGKLKLTNDQLDIILVGDMRINQFGDKEMDFAGELVIVEGKFYYYGDVFEIEEGYLTFDNKGFNPYLDVSAYTIIDGERIDINILGNVDNPLLTFTSESGFSQSDILELLTWRKRFEEQELSTTGISYRASDLVLGWFGSQLDKNILKLSGLNRLGILENIDVRGTSGLLTAEKDFSISAPITENVALNYAYRRSFGLSDSYHSLGVELRLNRNLSLIGNIDRSGYMHVKYRLRYAY